MTSVDGHRLLRGVFWARLAVAALLLPLGILLPEGMTPGINHSILALALLTVAASSGALLFGPPLARPRRIAWLIALLDVALRSEEHTSELQSLTNLVCRLLLEKKKK